MVLFCLQRLSFCIVTTLTVCGFLGYGHKRRQGYEAPKIDLLKPRKYIHSGLVDWKLIVNSGPQQSLGSTPQRTLHCSPPSNRVATSPYTYRISWLTHGRDWRKNWHFRGTSLTRNHPPLGPYRRPMPRVLGGS